MGENFGIAEGKFRSGGNSRQTADLTVCYQPETVTLYFSLTLMCSMTSCQYL